MTPATESVNSEQVTFECSDCDATVTLKETEPGSGYYDIRPFWGWSSPPIRCPKCSERVGAT